MLELRNATRGQATFVGVVQLQVEGQHNVRPCDRCGLDRQVNKRGKTNICHDCRWADPWFTAAIAG